MINYNAEFLDAAALARLPFAALGENVLIDSSVRLIGVENISIGSKVRIDAGTIIIATGPVSIGSWVHVAANCYLEGRAGIVLDDFSGLSSYVSLHSASDDFSGRSLTNPTVPEAYKTLKEGMIRLCRHVIVGAKATILPGVEVGEGAVVGAHSLVRKSIAPWTINTGSPSRQIGQRSRDLLEMERRLLIDLGRME